MNMRILVVGSGSFMTMHPELLHLLDGLSVLVVREELNKNIFEIKARQDVSDFVLQDPGIFRAENRELLAERKKLWRDNLQRAKQKGTSSKMKVSKK